jgi:hypothetical protein
MCLETITTLAFGSSLCGWNQKALNPANFIRRPTPRNSLRWLQRAPPPPSGFTLDGKTGDAAPRDRETNGPSADSPTCTHRDGLVATKPALRQGLRRPTVPAGHCQPLSGLQNRQTPVNTGDLYFQNLAELPPPTRYNRHRAQIKMRSPFPAKGIGRGYFAS